MAKERIDWAALGGADRLISLRKSVGSTQEVANVLMKETQRVIGRNTITDYMRRAGRLQEFRNAGMQRPAAEEFVEPDIDDAKDRKILQLQNHVAKLRQDNTKMQKQLISHYDLADRLAAEAVEPLPDPGFSRFKNTGPKERDVILPIYDMQFGSLVRPEDTPAGIGGFNAEIFKKRLDTYVTAATNEIADHAASHTEQKFIIVLGGDMVEGHDIFFGQHWFIEFNPIEQVWKLAHLMVHALHEIYGFAVEELGVDKTALLMIPGNHGKAVKGAAPANFSWDYLLYTILEDKLKNYPIDVMGIETGGSLYFQSQKKVFLALHGDEFKGWGGIPFYGLQRQDSRSLRLTHTMFDYGLVGHHHQAANIPIGYGEWFMSGNWVGATEFTRKIQASNTPQQAILFNSEKYGVSQSSKIMLEERRTPQPHVFLADD